VTRLSRSIQRIVALVAIGLSASCFFMIEEPTDEVVTKMCHRCLNQVMVNTGTGDLVKHVNNERQWCVEKVREYPPPCLTSQSGSGRNVLEVLKEGPLHDDQGRIAEPVRYPDVR